MPGNRLQNFGHSCFNIKNIRKHEKYLEDFWKQMGKYKKAG